MIASRRREPGRRHKNSIVLGTAYSVHALSIDRDSEALARRQVAITREVVRAGLQPPSAMKIAELQVALRHEAILRDEMTIIDQSLAVRRVAGLELTSTPLLPSDELQVLSARDPRRRAHRRSEPDRRVAGDSMPRAARR